MGWEEAYSRWVAQFPSRLNLNAAYGMLAAERGISWKELSPADRDAARRIVTMLRQTDARRSR